MTTAEAIEGGYICGEEYQFSKAGVAVRCWIGEEVRGVARILAEGSTWEECFARWAEAERQAKQPR